MPSSGRIRNPARLPQPAAIAATPPRALDGPGLRQRRADMANRPAGPDVGAKGETIVAERFLCVGENGEDSLGAGHGFSCPPPVRQSCSGNRSVSREAESRARGRFRAGRDPLPCGPHPVLAPPPPRPGSCCGKLRQPACSVRAIREVKARQVASVCAESTPRGTTPRAILAIALRLPVSCPDSNGSRVARRLLWLRRDGDAAWRGEPDPPGQRRRRGRALRRHVRDTPLTVPDQAVATVASAGASPEKAIASASFAASSSPRCRQTFARTRQAPAHPGESRVTAEAMRSARE